jgi:hypothetical protein
MANIYIYGYIFTIGLWQPIFESLQNKLNESGLLQISTEINLVVLGKNKIENLIRYPKITVLDSPVNIKSAERSCLQLIRRRAIREKGIFFYFQITPDIGSNYPQLVSFHIEEFQNRLHSINIQGTSGIPVSGKKYYLNNWWWAPAEYLKTLPSIIGKHIIDPFMWIVKNYSEEDCDPDNLDLDSCNYLQPPRKSRRPTNNGVRIKTIKNAKVSAEPLQKWNFEKQIESKNEDLDLAAPEFAPLIKTTPDDIICDPQYTLPKFKTIRTEEDNSTQVSNYILSIKFKS